MDVFDRAQEYDEIFRNAALSMHFARQRDVRRDALQTGGCRGPVLCIDCLEPISSVRLAAMPGVVRCIKCQAINERKS